MTLSFRLGEQRQGKPESSRRGQEYSGFTVPNPRGSATGSSLSRETAAGALFVCNFEIASGEVTHHRGGGKRDDGTARDVPGDRIGRVVLAEQPRRDQGCWPARDD